MRELTIEQMVRELLEQAIHDGLVEQGEREPQWIPSRHLVGTANLLKTLMNRYVAKRRMQRIRTMLDNR